MKPMIMVYGKPLENAVRIKGHWCGKMEDFCEVVYEYVVYTQFSVNQDTGRAEKFA